MPSTAPKVTVLALVYNQSRYLVEALDSILAQTFQDFELFVSDDASSDDSVHLIREWNAKNNRIDRLFLHDANIGLCPTLCEMFEQARGDYVQLMACDDQLLPDSLHVRVDRLHNCGDETAAVYSDSELMDEHGTIKSQTFLQRFLRKAQPPEGDLYPQMLLGNFIPVMSVLSKRRCVEDVGGFDPQLAFEDWDLWLRLSRRYDFKFVPGPVSRYRIHDSNLHQAIPRSAAQNYRILSKHRDVFRARQRILLTIIRNRDELSEGTEEIDDFFSWANEYPDTRWFRKSFFAGGLIARGLAAQMAEHTESCIRLLTKPSRKDRLGRAA